MSETIKTKAADLNKANRALVEQLANETDAAKQSDLFRSYLKSQAAFWGYSWHNQMHIYRQRPDASFVAGFNSWIKCGRFVRKGEKGIAILAPMFFKDKNKAEVDENGVRIWFKVVYVFERLSRDLRSSCALDVVRECHFRKSSTAACTSSLNSSALCNAP
jgi:N-terminal domain of anti-restriction factor ArdC